jgi:hypothetical protein
LLPGLFVLLSPSSYSVGGGCKNGLCALPVPEINYAIFVAGLALSIIGNMSMAIFLYRRWWLDNTLVSI